MELMIAVAIVGTLATIAIPSFTEYKYRVMRSEVQFHLAGLFNGAAAYYSLEHATEGLDGQLLTKCRISTACVGPNVIPSGEKVAYDFSVDGSCRALSFNPDGPVSAYYAAVPESGADCGTATLGYNMYSVFDMNGDGDVGFKAVVVRAKDGALYRAGRLGSDDEIGAIGSFPGLPSF